MKITSAEEFTDGRGDTGSDGNAATTQLLCIFIMKSYSEGTKKNRKMF